MSLTIGADPKGEKNMYDLESQTKLENPAGSTSNTEVNVAKYPVTVSWQDLTYTVPVNKGKTRKTIVQPATGYAAPGEFVALMGASGSGKTSFLDLLAGRVRKENASGSVHFNGQSVSKKWRQKMMSYVAQEDTLMGNLTVEETVMFAARFHYGWEISAEQIKARVDEVLEAMGLQDCSDTLVGDMFKKGISGGQKRRLSIAVELVSSPAVLLLDEPTSGLDSASALSVISHLRKLAHEGNRTIIATIHQPNSEIWALFDKLMLLAKGETIYFGKGSDVATQYFERIGTPVPTNYNPADFLISLINTDFTEDTLPENVRGRPSIQELALSYKNSAHRSLLLDDMQKYVESTSGNLQAAVEASTSKKYSFLVDLFYNSKRNLLNNARNPGIFWVRFVMYAMLSLVVGLMYVNLGDDFSRKSVNGRTSILFFIVAFLIFMSIAVLPFFIEIRATFIRESQNGAYGPGAYVISNFLMAQPGIFLVALISSLFVVLIPGLNNMGMYIAILYLSLMFAESFMNVIAALIPQFIVGIAVAAGCFGLFMLFGGFVVIKSTIPHWLTWGWYIAPHTYAFRAFMYNEFAGIKHFDGEFPDGMAVLEFYNMENAVIWHDLLVLFAWAVALQIVFYLLLKNMSGRR